MEERLKELRRHLDVTQKVFARSISLGQSTWAMIEAGKRELNDRHIKLICTIYDVNEQWLRTGTGEMFEELTEQQKVMKYAGMLLKEQDTAVSKAIKTFIATYEQLDEQNKKTMNYILETFMENYKKSQ